MQTTEYLQTGPELTYDVAQLSADQEARSWSLSRVATYATAGFVSLGIAISNVAPGTASAAALASPAGTEFSDSTFVIPATVSLPEHYVPNKRAPAVVVAIHGGAWLAVGKQYQDTVSQDAERLYKAGNEVYSIDYRAGANSIQDVDSQVKQVINREPNRPVILWGISAGGHLALMAALNNPKVVAVEAEATPTNLPLFETSGTEGFTPLYPIITGVFGKNNLIANSPALRKWGKRTPMLLSCATTDKEVPCDQMSSMKKQAPWAQTYAVKKGSVLWAHSPTSSQADVNVLKIKEANFIKAASTSYYKRK